jgi:hypothetical protein
MALALMPAAQAASSVTTLTASNHVKSLTPGSGLTNAGPRKTLATMKLEPGHSYLVSLPVTVKHTNPDQVDYVAVSLVCEDAQGHEDTIGQAVNTLHGTSFTLDPRLYITIKKVSGSNARGVCVGYAQETRIHGPSSASPSSRTINVTSSQLIIKESDSYANAHETVRFKDNNPKNKAANPYAGVSSRASKGVRFHAASVAFTLTPANHHSLSVMGSVYLTACISTGGSRDASTDGKNLCTPSTVKSGGSGPLVRTRLIVQQFKANGTTVCRTVVVPNTTSTFHIPALRHHLPVSLQGTVSLPASASCGSHFKAYTEVYVESAPSVVVHFPSSVTSVLPL